MSRHADAGLPTAADFLVGCQLRAFEKTCADKVTMPAALAAYTERLFALPAVAGLVNPCILPMLRGIFQQCIPHGYEAAFFSLVGVCTVGFAWVGSVVFAGVWSATGSPRWGMLAVTSFVAVGLAFVAAFDFDAAQERRREIEDERDAFAGGAFDSLRSEASKRGGRRRRNGGGSTSLFKPLSPNT